uniref:Uncharacterized protein n=1 Tax=Avena sativa TaxID=4498 RepID=A0ACD5WGJ4_AVESA
MALRYLVSRMRTPAAAALHSPVMSRGSQAARSRPFSATASRGEHEDILKMNARKKYEFYLAHLESVENNLHSLRVFTERCERASRYLSLSFKVVFVPAALLDIAVKGLK